MENTTLNWIIGGSATAVAIMAFADEFPSKWKLDFLKDLGTKVLITVFAFILGTWATIKKENKASDEFRDNEAQSEKRQSARDLANAAELKRQIGENDKKNPQTFTDVLARYQLNYDKSKDSIFQAMDSTRRNSNDIRIMAEEQKNPVSPMNINFYYRYNLSKAEFYKQCPYYKDSVPHGMYVLNRSDLAKMDLPSARYLGGAKISSILQIDSTTRVSLSKKKWLPIDLGTATVNNIDIALNNDIFEITVDKTFENVYPENLDFVGINDVRRFKGWFLRLAYDKTGVNQFSTIVFRMRTGIPAKQRVYHTFDRLTSSRGLIIYKLTPKDFMPLMEAP